ncbi:MAG: dienelactone hydrolase family protein [Bryocella sp.]
MKRLVALAAALAFTTLAAAAQGPHDTSSNWARANLDKSPRHGEYVTIKEPSGRVLHAWVVYPEIKAKAPVVVMIHEIFGLTDWAREMADEVASAGYIVVEPDLLSGFGPALSAAPPATNAPIDHVHVSTGGVAFMPMSPGGTSAFPDQSGAVRAVSSLDPAIVTADLDAAADYGKKLASASGKLYVAGFCWGGTKSFAFATHRKDLSGAFVFYGAPPSAEAMKQITAPVYGFYAGNDARISATVPQTILDMKAAGKKYDPKIYDGAGHGFMRAGEAPDATAENAAARAAGFRRFISLLGGMR